MSNIGPILTIAIPVWLVSIVFIAAVFTRENSAAHEGKSHRQRTAKSNGSIRFNHSGGNSRD